jgi:archaeosortase B (VPXXXP-CTERM-specific)
LGGIDAGHTGTTVHVGAAGMEIVSECSAIYVLILFSAAVIAFPTTWRARLRGLAVGIPVLLVVNVVRLVTIGAVIQHKPALLPLFHEYLWQVLFVLVVAGLYLFWMEKVIPRARVGPAA